MISFNQQLLNKILLFVLIFSIFLFDIPIAKAITIEELQAQILKLQAQIVELEKQIAELQSEGWCYDFKVNLKYKEHGEKIRALQIALEKEGLFKVSPTGYFGPYTFEKVQLFQEKYKKDILEPWGAKKGTGFVGLTTRTKLNELYGCTKIHISSLSPQPGDTLVIKVKTKLPLEIKGRLNSEKINFFKFGNHWLGIIGISVKEKLGKYNLVIDYPNEVRVGDEGEAFSDLPEGEFLRKELNIIERKFPVTELLVTKELEEKEITPSKIEENVAKENLVLQEVLSVFTPEVYFDQSFIYPLEKIKDVGAFGNIRKSGKITLQHLGVDLEAATGTPVYAINDGRVGLSRELTNYGKTIIIDHGMGIFSLYLHLNEFKVFEGKEVKRGDIIALSGNTGYAIEPHLHFSVKINGTSIDPLRFIETIEKER